MKLPAPMVLSLSAFAMAASKNQAENSRQCRKANPDIIGAINDFCWNGGNDNIMVPSPYAAKGKEVGNVKVYIKGKCNPPQWLPRKYCYSQFHEVCGGKKPYGQTHNGRNKCQDFHIHKKGDYGWLLNTL